MPALVSEPVEQLSCADLLCQPAERDARHGSIEKHFTGRDQAFVVAAHAPVPSDPGETSLHHPSAFEDMEAARDLGWGLAWSEPHTVQTRPPMLAGVTTRKCVLCTPPLSTKDSDGAADLDAALRGPAQLAADR
jgi:hypothetical protein